MRPPEPKSTLWQPFTKECLPAYGEMVLFRLARGAPVRKSGNYLVVGETYLTFMGVVEYTVDGWGARVPVRIISMAACKQDDKDSAWDIRGYFDFRDVSHWCRIPE